jgi:hypothetical protein
MTGKAVCVFAAVLAGAACYVPVSSSAPQSPTTAGAGNWRGSGFVEAPVLDVLGTVASAPSAASPNRYPSAGLPVFNFEVAAGLTERVDFEVGVEGGIYLLPIPNAAFAGVRHHVHGTENLDIAWAARAGYAGFLAVWNEQPYDGSKVRAAFGSVSASARVTKASLQPGVALALQPMWIMPDVAGPSVDNLAGLSATTTLSLRYRGVTPFVSGGVITSQNARGTGPLISVGLAWTP